MLNEDVDEAPEVEPENVDVVVEEPPVEEDDDEDEEDEDIVINDGAGAGGDANASPVRKEPLPVQEFDTTMGTASDGKGSVKKVFFLQKKEGDAAQPAAAANLWKKVSAQAAAAAAAAVEAGAKFRAPAEKKAADEASSSDAEPAEGDDTAKTGSVTKLLASGRASLTASAELASTRITGLMASYNTKKESDDGAAVADDAAPAEAGASAAVGAPSRLDKLRSAMHELGAPKDDKVASLEKQVNDLRAIVEQLAAKVEALEQQAS
mmetsp:Transcript_4942/g.15655  ORF Transcript_4942/g.15655 Transcript_4942/m.15655 type:complete len:265 (-) Transcript_4942:152-946(-)